MPLRITCVVCARNELAHLRILIPHLMRQNIEIVVIDNDSTDGTLDWIRSADEAGRIEFRHLPWEGAFDLTAQLAVKGAVVASLHSDWVIHQDADEILQGPTSWDGLRRCVEEADQAGFNVLNFDELVMLPLDPDLEDPYSNNRLFYFFEPRPLRLMRAWRRTAGLNNEHAGGHVLTGGNIYVSPVRPLLKHFIVRSQAHARQKYLARIFAVRDLEKGWHGNRIGLTEAVLKLPVDDARLTLLPEPQSTPNPMPNPIDQHFWEWRRP